MIFERNLLHVAKAFLNQFRINAKINGNHQNFKSSKFNSLKINQKTLSVNVCLSARRNIYTYVE